MTSNKETLTGIFLPQHSYYTIAKQLPYHNDLIFQHIKEQLSAYFIQKTALTFKNFFFYGTDFQKQVWHSLLDIEFGQTVSYFDIACRISKPLAVRAVAGAISKNPLSILVPCHRVIGKNGHITGYAGGIQAKEFLLNLEKHSSL